MWTLPNILTIIRLIAAPMVAVMFLYLARPYADWAALILFVGAALTDWLDGFLARAWKPKLKTDFIKIYKDILEWCRKNCTEGF